MSSVEPESGRLGEEYRNILNECGIGRSDRIVYVTWLSMIFCIDINRRRMLEDDQWQCYLFLDQRFLEWFWQARRGSSCFTQHFSNSQITPCIKTSLPASALYYTQAKAIVDMIGDQYFAIDSYPFCNH